MSDPPNWTLDSRGHIVGTRFLRFGCWLNGHAIIRWHFGPLVWSCRCGQRAITGHLYKARYG